jgi:hypothetical protein
LKNGHILYYIKKKLGFGVIRKIRFLDTIILEYQVKNTSDQLQIIKIFLGQFRCPKKKQHFLIFYQKIKVKLKKYDLLHKLPDYKDDLKNITLKSS